jgi:FtsH-binding integral membrane protein
MNAKDESRAKFWHRCYKLVSLTLSIAFGIVGIVFLAIPAQVLGFFNDISLQFGLPESPAQGTSFFLILAVAYMYLVCMLAFMMYKHPENSAFPLLLISGKSASSIASILFIVVYGHCLIYIVNAITDGSIALGVFLLSRKIRERQL